MVKVPDFDALYEADPDPFHVRSSFYEQRKIGLVLDCLTKPLYAAAWDPACGIGELAARLAARAERVLASDASPQAVHLARRRCSSSNNVEVKQLVQPQRPPYEADPDPFHVRSSFYEQRKIGLVLDCLTKPSYAAAWDPACGIGELAARLAARAERVLASDASPQAVHLARRRCSSSNNVEVKQLVQPQRPPCEADPFDLIVMSEFGYYLTDQVRRATLDVLHEVAAERAELVAVHWRHHPHDAYISGEQVQEEVVAGLEPRGWRHVVQHDDRDFIIDVLELASR